MPESPHDKGAFLIPAFITAVVAALVFGPALVLLPWPAILDNGEKIFTILGIIVGGAWTYYGFIKGRIYIVRLEPRVTGKVVVRDGIKYLIAILQLRNVGVAKIELQPDNSGLQVLQADEYFSEPLEGLPARLVKWVAITTFPVFMLHQWIESGETIEEQLLVALPPNEQSLYKLVLRLTDGKTEWNAVGIVEMQDITSKIVS